MKHWFVRTVCVCIAVALCVAAHGQDAALELLQQSLKDIGARLATIDADLSELQAKFGNAVPISEAQAKQSEFFEKNVRPVLLAKCVACHGPDKQKGGLRLDSAEAFAAGADGHALVVAGDPDKSLLAEVIRYTGETKMPPDSALPASEVDAIVEWIRMGASWPASPAGLTVAAKAGGIDYDKGREFWAFKPIAEVTPPVIEGDTWSRSDIDRFIYARLNEAGLSPAAPADKRTLIRRATFDLIGLPPTPAEVQDFLNDESPEAFATVVERLLASPHYGERWGRHWLDVVRYTDSFDSRGTPQTDPVEIWRYRDWVVNAMNKDMPFDRFMMYQVAGDLMPPADDEPQHPADPAFNRDGMIATGMLAIGHWPQGDADKQKMVSDIVDDQIDVVSRGFLALTMGCARCHDHKFDPISARDYYGMAGIFFSSTILPGPGQKTEGSPILHMPLAPPAIVQAETERQAQAKANSDAIAQRMQALRASWAQNELQRLPEYVNAAVQATNTPLAEVASTAGLNADALRQWRQLLGIDTMQLMTAVNRDLAGHPGLHALHGTQDTPSFTVNMTDKALQFLTILQPASSVAAHPSPTGSVGVVWENPGAKSVEIQASLVDIDPTCGDGVTWSIKQLHGGSVQELISGTIDSGKESGPIVTQAVLEKGDRVLLDIGPRGGHACDSTGIRFHIVELEGEGREWDLTHDVAPTFLAQGKTNPFSDSYGNASVWSAIDLAGDSAALRQGFVAAEAVFGALVNAIQAQQAGGAVDAVVAAAGDVQKQLLANEAFKALMAGEKGPFWLAALPETVAQADTELAGLLQTQQQLAAAAPPEPFETVVGVREGGVPGTEHEGIRDSHIFIRGDYARLGEVVPRQFPIVLAGAQQQTVTQGSGRLQLAQWLASPTNPLPARVMINRIWQHHFGEGIVRTPGNFGKQGIPPTDPALLDYLARQFVNSGWSMKAMHRSIMLSSVYQQASTTTPEAIAADPENKLFGRMNRQRLEAEAIRDSMLLTTGILDSTAGGPADPDFMKPRRTLYYRTVRSDRTTFNMLFDAADPTSIIDKRIETTVAPQALFLLNHPFSLAQAKALATQVETFGPSDAERIAALYERLYIREVKPEEIELGIRVLERARQQAATNPDAQDPWVSYCHVLLCSNEFVFID